MKWSHDATSAPAALLTDDQRRAQENAHGRAHRKKHKSSSAGARSRRAPAKKHMTFKNRVRALLGKPPLPDAPPKRTRLFTQMLLSFIVLTLVTSFVAGALNVTLVRNYVQDSSMETLLDRVAAIADMVVRPGGSLKVINVQQLDEWERLTNAQVILINTDMTLVTRQMLRNRRLTVTMDMDTTQTQAVDDEGAAQDAVDAEASGDASDVDNTQILSAIDYELVSSILSGQTVADVRQFDFMEGTWLFAGVPIISGGQVDGGVLLCQPLSQIDGVSRNISLIMSLAGSISTLFAIMLSLLLTQRIVQPVAAMTRTAQRMANGNYGERVTIPTTTEIAQLGESLNHLSGNLYTTIRSLNQEKIKMELVLSGIGEGIMAINQIGKMVHCNDAAVKLLELREEDAQCDVYELTERSPLIGMLIQVLETGETLDGGWKNGAGQSVSATVSPIRMGDDLVGAVGLVRDVSEAERLEQLRRDYVANISHELRTPLTGIRGMVEPLIDGVYDTEAEKQDCYHIIYQETLRLERLITDMLDISRLQDGRIHIDLEEMQVHGVLEAAARRLEKRADDEGVRLIVEQGEDPIVLGNEDRIMQVLIILIDNALKFTPAGGSVTLRTRLAEGMLWLSVRDTGAGIAKDDLPYIFERFYKADKSRMETRGTGLGLAIARLVVELMGGTIWCESELGHGSTFEFSLKLAGQADGAADTDESDKSDLQTDEPDADTEPIPRPRAADADAEPIPRPRAADADAEPIPRSRAADADAEPIPRPRAADADAEPIPRPRAADADTEPVPRPRAADADAEPIPRPRAADADTDPASSFRTPDADEEPIPRPRAADADAELGMEPIPRPRATHEAEPTSDAVVDQPAPRRIAQSADVPVETHAERISVTALQPAAHGERASEVPAQEPAPPEPVLPSVSPSESLITRAQLHEAAVLAGIDDEGMEFDELLKQLLRVRRGAAHGDASHAPQSTAQDGAPAEHSEPLRPCKGRHSTPQ